MTTAHAAADAAIAAWSTAWASALPKRSSVEQAQLVERATRAVVALQQAAARSGAAGRALHHRPLYAAPDATFTTDDQLPRALSLGPFVPGHAWPATVRLSSAYPVARDDNVPDQRGLAVRLTSGERRLSLLATTGQAHHARDASAMIASLEAAAAAARGGPWAKLAALGRLVSGIGLRDGLRLARTVGRAAQSGVSLTALTYYSRAPFQLGPYAVRFRFRPLGLTESAPRVTGADELSRDLSVRLAEGAVSWAFELQGFLDSDRTPLDDHRVRWDSPWITAGSLTLHRASAPTPSGTVAALVEAMAFDPQPTWPDERGAVLQPLGDLNALRAVAYAASAVGRVAARDDTGSH